MTAVNMYIHHLKVMFENSTDFVFYMKKTENDYMYQYINPAAASTIPNIGVGKQLSLVMGPKLSKTIVKYYEEAIRTRKQTHFQDYTMFTYDIRKYESTIYPIFTEGEEYLLVITRLIAFDRNIEDKYLFMRSVFFKTFLSTVLLSKEFQLLEANPAFLQDFGITIEDVRGKKLHDIGLVDDEHEQKYLQYLKDAIKGVNISSKHLQFKDKTGELRHFIASFSPLTDDEDEVIAVFLILQETTEFIRQKQELKNISHTMDVLLKALASAADISITDINGRILEVNEKFVERSGYSREELLGKTHNVLNSGFHPDDFFQDLWMTISNGKIWRGEVCNLSKSGENYWYEATLIPITDKSGKVTQFLGIYFNVSDKKNLMTELRTIERTFRLITENTNDLIVIVNDEGIITYASPSYIRLFGIEEQQLIGMAYGELVGERSQMHWQKVVHADNLTEDVTELQLVLPNGETIWTECHYKATCYSTVKAKKEITMVSRIITERKYYEEKLVFMAYHDSLTQLPNRRFLEKEFPHLVENAKTQYQSLAVIYIDGDNFKQINDQYGHDVGDEFIRNFGQIIARNIKREDMVARMGGDEFVVLLTELSRKKEEYVKQIEEFFKRLQRDLSIGWRTNNITFTPTATMGIAVYPEHCESLDQLIDTADQMLFEAKEKGRNTFKIFNTNN